MTPEIAPAVVECRTCMGGGWVCENHPDRAWHGTADVSECCGGAGAPCGSCNLQMASAGYVEPFRRALLAIIARAPAAKPDGPYDPFGGYSSDNYGDVIGDARAEEAWECAEIARAALRTEASK